MHLEGGPVNQAVREDIEALAVRGADRVRAGLGRVGVEGEGLCRGGARSALLHGEAAGRGVRAARSNGEAERWDGLQREREAAGGAVGRLPQPLLLVRELGGLRHHRHVRLRDKKPNDRSDDKTAP